MISYCPHCAAKIEYSLNKPENCPKCKKAISKAFVKTVQPAPIVNNQRPTINTAIEPTNAAAAFSFSDPAQAAAFAAFVAQAYQIQNNAGNNVPKPRIQHSPDADGYDEYYDENEKDAILNEIKASLKGGLLVSPIQNPDKMTFGQIVAEVKAGVPQS